MTGGLFTSSSPMARRLRCPPERLAVRVLAQDSNPRAVRISLTWREEQSQSSHQQPSTTRRHLQHHVDACCLPHPLPAHTEPRSTHPRLPLSKSKVLLSAWEAEAVEKPDLPGQGPYPAPCPDLHLSAWLRAWSGRGSVSICGKVAWWTRGWPPRWGNEIMSESAWQA